MLANPGLSKAEPRWGSSILQTSFAPLFLLTRDEIKKAQRRRYYASVSMSDPIITNVITTQLGTSCSFDSPGLARNEPTLGKHSQGDSTP